MPTLTDEDILRRLRFSPYRKGMGPTFALTVWDTHRTIGGKSRLGYRLTMTTVLRDDDGEPIVTSGKVLFVGEDFGCSPLHCVDSDEAVKAIMGFLTLRPGDTDREYFADYTPDQLEFCSSDAEALAMEVMNRFGE